VSLLVASGAAADDHFSSVVRGAPSSEVGGQELVPAELLHAAPAETGGALLNRVPGVYGAVGESDAVGRQIYIRGSDAEQGQDLELKLGPVPLNQPGHIHGHGYADLDLVIPEVVRGIKVTEGVFDWTQGDFAISGTLEFDLGVKQRGLVERTSAGSFGSVRQLVLWAPRGQDQETFLVGQLQRSNGFGRNRASLTMGAIGQYAFTIGGWRVRVHAAAHRARAQSAGVVRRDDVENGIVGFYDVYPDAGARAQSAATSRVQTALTLERQRNGGGRTVGSAWIAYTSFFERRDLTGYLVAPELGDVADQRNEDLGVGASVSHRTRTLRAGWLSAALEFGGSYRLDVVDQSQDQVRARDGAPWQRVIAAHILGSSLGLFGGLHVGLTRHLRLHAGVRGEVLGLDATDHLRHDARYGDQAAAFGPRLALELLPLPWLTLYATYGRGFRSGSALQLLDGSGIDFAVAHSVEGGVRVRLLGGRIQARAAGFATFITRDLAFEPSDGRTEDSGATQFPGLTLNAMALPLRWLTGSASLTWTHATVIRPPESGGGDDGGDEARAGSLVPYAPQLVLRADVTAHGSLARVGGRPLSGRIGAGLTVLGPRPLPGGADGGDGAQPTSPPVALLDAGAALRWWFVEVGIDAYNLADQRYAATEYRFRSDWRTRPPTDAARHIAAAAPLRLLGTLTLYF
jgi:outer membrane receptor protein involved in Fe transport